uniref:Uncharacterized protein n=1 Tax=Araucaria cunninghamii TaxID=56994 RepID=A0A0D6R2Q9_ARACU
MGFTAVAGRVVQAGLPLHYGKTKRRGTDFSAPPTISCCHSSSEGGGGEKKTSSLSSSSSIISNAGKKLHNYFQSQSRERIDSSTNTHLEWDWDRWQEHFSEVEGHESLLAVLNFQLEEAIQSEDFQEALRLKTAIAATTEKDTVAEVMAKLKKAVEEERYSDAAQLRDDAGAGLVGWWVGLPQGSNDPYGRIIHISPAQGRFLAKSYSARQLAAAGRGVPLFEIFVTKEEDLVYKKQEVYLRCARGTSEESLPASEAVDANILGSSKNSSEGSKIDQTLEVSSGMQNNGDKSDDTDLMDDGLNRVLNFLRDRIPGIKFKILKVIAPEGTEMDTKMFEQLIQEDEEEKDENNPDERSEDDIKIEGDLEDDKETAGDNNSEEERKEIPIKIVIGGVLQSSSEDKAPRIAVRVPAQIEYKGRDSFVFHLEENDNQEQAAGNEARDLKVATIATQASADLMPPDVAKVFWNVKKGRSKVPRDIKEIIKLAVSEAQRRNDLTGSTMFQRINVAEANADPLTGLYIGAFGHYTSEVVQLRSRYGHWQNSNETLNEESRLEFFEYVEAVKLTGDLNVPAGQVTFRAKIGKENRLSNRGIYPDELGVIARYKGQGRVAEAGFHNPQWVDGELLLLDGKGSSLANGAELGFVYSVPERHFLVLFNRLKLQE